VPFAKLRPFRGPYNRRWRGATGATDSEPAGTTYSYTPDGGLTFAGVGALAIRLGATGAGGMQLGGVATIKRVAVAPAVGGLQFAGAATIRSTAAPTISGGLSLAGTAAMKAVRAAVGAGGLQLAGSAASVSARSVRGLGGLQFSGAASGGFRSVYAHAALGALSRFTGGGSGSFTAGPEQRAAPVAGLVVNPMLVARLLRARDDAERKRSKKARREEEEQPERPATPAPAAPVRKVYQHAAGVTLAKFKSRMSCRLVRGTEEEDELELMFRKAA
jgi:hypothetical protein